MVLPILSGIALNTFRFGKSNAHHLNAALLSAARQLSSAPPAVDELKAALASKIPAQQERLKALKKAYGSKALGEVTVDMCIGGMRGIPVSLRTGTWGPVYVYAQQAAAAGIVLQSSLMTSTPDHPAGSRHAVSCSALRITAGAHIPSMTVPHRLCIELAPASAATLQHFHQPMPPAETLAVACVRCPPPSSLTPHPPSGPAVGDLPAGC
jgi:hypothetical protein